MEVESATQGRTTIHIEKKRGAGKNMGTGKKGRLRAPLLACALGIGIGAGISGCTTVQMLGEAGDSFSEGNVGTGIFRGVSGVLFGPVIDVFTLGGAIDSPEKARAVTQSATTVMAARSNSRGTTPPLATVASIPPTTTTTSTYTAPAGNPATNAQQMARPQAAVANGGGGSNTTGQKEKDPFIYTANVNHCLVVEPNTSGPTRQRMRNACSFGIRFTFCNVGGRQNECAMRRTAGGSLRAGATDYMIDDVYTIQAVVCPDPYYLPSGQVIWNGDRMNGRCQANT